MPDMRRNDIHRYASDDQLEQVYLGDSRIPDGIKWVGAVYREEPTEPWQVCRTNADGTSPVRGTFATARLAAVALVEAIERKGA